MGQGLGQPQPSPCMAAWLGAEICPIIWGCLPVAFFPRASNAVYSHTAWLNNNEAPEVQATAPVVMATRLLAQERFLT